MAHVSALIARDIDQYLEAYRHQGLLRFITCGSVDDGKSTLIGRLLYDANLLDEDQVATLTADSRRVGRLSFTGTGTGRRWFVRFQYRHSGSPARQAFASLVAASASIRRRGRGRILQRRRTSASSARQASSAVVCTLTVGAEWTSPTRSV